MIKISNLCVFYDGEEILHDLSAAFPKGKASVILGPNGCGKSTLLRSLVRLNSESTGNIFLQGENVDSLTRQELSRRIAYLPQTRSVPDITVERLVLHGRFPYIGYPRRYRKEDHDIVNDVLERMELTEFRKRKMEHLSGGQRQKVYLAMALAQETDVILMDEPTTFLDIHNQLEMLEHIRALCTEGKTIVMILHDFDLALSYADHCLLMNNGRIVRSGSARQVLAAAELQDVFKVKTKFYESDDGIHCYTHIV